MPPSASPAFRFQAAGHVTERFEFGFSTFPTTYLCEQKAIFAIPSRIVCGGIRILRARPRVAWGTSSSELENKPCTFACWPQKHIPQIRPAFHEPCKLKEYQKRSQKPLPGTNKTTGKWEPYPLVGWTDSGCVAFSELAAELQGNQHTPVKCGWCPSCSRPRKSGKENLWINANKINLARLPLQTSSVRYLKA